MRLIPVTLCAATTVAAALLPATVATAAATAAEAAEGPGAVAVSPSVISRGEDVDLRVHCAGGRIVGTSEAFAADVAFSPAADRGAMYAEARIRADARAKVYPVEVRCHGRRSAGSISVVRRTATVPLPTPTAPVHAGGGATAVLAADEDAAGTRNAVLGLVLAGVAAVTVAARGFRRRRDDE
ncbi:hypothetical protein AB0M87_06270 [Streptomyces sp. NPDC051320]|uniref:hypothetical protein n=1 Tax=Streptomyces sp. NPDC051320 TaxID=3154644 RepID=UPI00341E55CD